MSAAVVLLILIAISAPVVCRGEEHAKPTGLRSGRLLMRDVKGWHMTLRGVDLEKWNERGRLSEEFG